jgi:glucose/arabinose dehydrogenase
MNPPYRSQALARETRCRRRRAGTAWRRRVAGALLLLLCAGSHGDTYRVETLVDGLHWPRSVVQLPGGDFLVAEREGRILRIDSRGGRRQLTGSPRPLTDVQGAYLDLALHPEFNCSRLLYLSYVDGGPAANATAVFRARLEDTQLLDGQRIMRVAEDKATSLHHGGRLLFLQDHTLLLSVGDGFEFREKAQSLDSELGKVLHLEANGLAALGNPFRSEGRRRIWTYGHRNPLGMAQDHASGVVYLHEQGPGGGDEVNILKAGRNYGWPAVTHGVDFSGALVSPFRRAADMRSPIHVWTPGIGPSGMALYTGREFQGWRGSLLVGGLLSRDLRRLQINAGRVVQEEILLAELGAPIRDVRTYGEKILVLTDGPAGRLLQLYPRRPGVY